MAGRVALSSSATCKLTHYRAMEYIGVWALLLLPICLFITALVVLAAGHFEAATVTLFFTLLSVLICKSVLN